MNIVWFSWKDIHHPQAGGAESVGYQVMKRLVRDGHSVTLITTSYKDARPDDVIDGIRVHRTGNRFTVYLGAFLYYRSHLRGSVDLCIDEMNTIPFGAAFYSRTKSVLLAHQLAREVWFYQMVWPLSWVGYVLEPFYLWLMARKYKSVLTISESSRSDLVKFGFSRNMIHIMDVGIELKPISKLNRKKNLNRVIFLGALRPMKRTLDAVKAFEFACDINPDLTMEIAGDKSSSYGRAVEKYIQTSRHRRKIKLLGRVDNATRLALVKQAAVIVVTSIKEGWGLIVTEANSQGTPAVAYDVDGLRDSVRDGSTGLLVNSGDTQRLGKAIQELVSSDHYEMFRMNAWEMSKQFTYENMYESFKRATF